MSLAMVDGSAGAGGHNAPARMSDPGSAMDPSHTFRTLVIEMLRGDASARQDLVKAFDDLNQGNIFQSPRLLYFLLDNCKMDKLSRLPENIVGLWMGYLQRAPPQPALRDLIVLEGQLGKQGSKGWSTKGWKMKWFVMTDSFLCYYNKLTDKQEGKEPRKQIPLSAVIRLQMVGADVSGMDCSFEIITEQENPNWKVHANISEDDGESQLYYSRWQSAIEEAVRGARDLDRGKYTGNLPVLVDGQSSSGMYLHIATYDFDGLLVCDCSVCEREAAAVLGRYRCNSGGTGEP